MASSVQIPVTQTGLEASIQAALRNAGKNAQINLGTNSRQVNALAQPLGRITGQADEFTKSMEAANARVFAFGASVGIINSVSKAFGALVKNTIAVEKSLVEINSVLGKSSSEIDKFGGKLFEVAKNTGQSFEAVSKGALELARQGLSTEETLKRINDALILTRLSGLDAGKSVDGLTAAVNSFKNTGITTSEVLNKLVNVSQKYAVSEKDLIEGLKRSSSVAKQAGVSFDELVGIITAVQEKSSVGGAVIGNSFKTIFTRLQRKDTLEALQQLGVEVTDIQGRILPATKLLENLAGKIKGLNQIQLAEITEKVGGGFQIDKLISTLEDLGSKGSIAFKATKLSAESTNQAYEKNAALNKTLANLINETTLSAQELGATLGKLGITDNAKNLLGFFNSVLESIQKILGEESTLGNVFRGLAKGIGNLVSGPGLALFGAIILKLSKDLAQFGFASLKSFFGIGKAAKEVQTLEKSIAQALASNVKLQQQLFSLEGNRAAQIKVMTDAIIQQEAAMRRMASTSSSLAGPLYQQGVRGTSSGLRVPKAAGGYMPAVAQEASDINRGVGGAKSGDRPVVIPNFNFGGGKKGSIVAHTGEYAVPNFNGSGGTAIFNRDMVRSMGLPSGAKKISAAGGLIPNFARKTLNFNEKGKLSSGDEYLLDNEYYSGVADVGLDSLSKNAVNYRKTVFKLRGESLNSATNRIIDKGSADTIKKALGDAVGSTDVDLWLENRKIAKGQVKPLSKGSTKKTVDFKKQRTGLFSAVKGALFESYLKKNRNDIISFGEGSTQPLDFDFKEKTNSLGIEAKSGDFSTHQLIAKAIRAKYGSKYKNKKENTIGKIGTVDLFVPSAASGFIPNFAAKPNASVDTIRAAVAEGIEAYRRPGLNEYGQPFKTYWFPDGSQASQGQVEKALKQNPSIASTKKKEDAEKRQKKMDEKGVMDFVIDANTLGGIALVTPARGGSSGTLSAQSLMQNLPKKPEGFLMDDKLIIENIQSTGVPTQKNFEQISSEINKRFAGPIVDLAQSLYGKLYSGVSGSDFASKLGQLRSTSKGGILPPGAEGQIFEAAGKAALTSMSQIASAFDPSKENRPFDFTNAASMKEMLGVTAVRGDAKRAGGSKRQFQETVNGLLKKSINDNILKPKIFSQIKQQAKGRKLPENLPENAAAGFIPNFVSKTREIGAGAEGRFLRLGKKDGLDVGVKKFGKDVSNTEVGKEWLLGQYINRYLGVSGVTGPKIMSTLDSSMKNRRIRKEIVSGDLGKTALGMEKSYRFGLGTLRSAIKAKGLDLTDLHGGNYIINNNAKKYISGLSSYPTDPISSTQLLKEMASKGGFASVIDPGFGKLTGSPARQIVDKMITHLENLKTNAARGFLPNFAQKSFRMEDDYGWSYRQYRTKNGSALDFERDIDYERDQEYLKLTGVKSEKKGDAYKLFLQLAKLAKRTKMPIYSDELISQAERKLRGAKEPVDFNQMSNWDELMYKFPQLRYRQIPRLKTSGSFGSISFKTLDGLKKLVTKMPKKEFQSQMSFGVGELISKYASRGFLPNFAVDLNKSEDYTQNQRKRSSKARTYRNASGVIGSLFKTLPEKFFSDGILGDAAQGLETDGIFDAVKNSALYAASFAGPNAVKFVIEAEKYGLKVSKGLQKKLASLTTKAVGKVKGFSSGFLPNFADPLKEAVGREMAAGVPASQIYIDKNQSLKSAANPMGLMVANRRDEPAGGHQGISRAIREGRNPKTYGASGGFVPNYAEANVSPYVGMKRSEALDAVEKDYRQALKELAKELREAKKDLMYTKAEEVQQRNALKDRIKNIKENSNALKMQTQANKSAINKETRGVLGSGRTISGKSATVTGASQKQGGDMLGTIFALQGAMSMLTGATEGATGDLGKFTNSVANGLSTFATMQFGFQGLSQALPKFAGFLGPAGLAISGLTALYQSGIDIYNRNMGITDAVTQSMEILGKAAGGAAINLSTLGTTRQAEIKKEAKSLGEEYLKTGEKETVQLSAYSTYGTYGSGSGTTQSYTVDKKATFQGEIAGSLNTKLRDQYTKAIEEAIGAQVPKADLEKYIKSIREDGIIMSDELTMFSNNVADAIAKAAEKTKQITSLLNEENYAGLAGLTNTEFEEIMNPALIRNPEERAKVAGYKSYQEYEAAFRKNPNAWEGKSLTERFAEASGLNKEKLKALTQDLDDNQIKDYYKLLFENAKNLDKQRKDDAVDQIELSNQALKNTIQNIKIEAALRGKLSAKTKSANTAQLSSEAKIAAIKSDLSLSEGERTRLIENEQFALEKQLSNLENQKEQLKEISELSKEISTKTPSIKADERAAAASEIEEAIKRVSKLSDLGADTNIKKSLKGLDLIQTVNPQDIIKAALSLQQSTSQRAEDEQNIFDLKGKQLSLTQAEAKVNEQNARVLERSANSISAMADDRAAQARRLGYQGQLAEARKNVELTKLANSDPSMSPFERRAKEESIIERYFQMQLKNEAKKSTIEAEADFMRNAKIEDNILALGDNNKALKENTDALLKVKSGVENEDVLQQSLGFNGESDSAPAFSKGLLGIAELKINQKVFDEFNDEANNCSKTIKLFAKEIGLSTDGVTAVASSWKNFGQEVDKSELKPGDILLRSGSGGVNQTGNHVGMYLGDNKVLQASQKAFDANPTTKEQRVAITEYDANSWQMARRAGLYSTAQSGITQSASVSIENQMKKARELSSLSSSSDILESAREYTSQLGLQDQAAENVAKNITNLAARIKEIGEEKALQEELHKAANESERISNAIKSIAELEKIDLKKQLASLQASPSTFEEGMENAFISMEIRQAQFAYNLGKEIPDMFSQGMSNAIMSAVEGTSSLKDGLRSAAYEFVKQINSKMISNLSDSVVSNIGKSSTGQGVGNFFSNLFNSGYASGGKVNGGSGSKDDVPAMLMGGEYVINKKAVQKYGPQFLEAINNGTIGGYAAGGQVLPMQTGKGGFFTPGTYGLGAIEGKRNLLDFATQAYTSGEKDQIISGDNFASISLEPESMRLTNFGRMNSPQAEATRAAKEQAFGLYVQEVQAEAERARQKKEEKKAFKRQLIMAVGMAVAGPILQAGAAGFSNAFNAAKGTGFGNQLWEGTKGIVSGGNIGGTKFGGLQNLFSGRFDASQISGEKQLEKYINNNRDSNLTKNYLNSIPRAFLVDEGPFNKRRATGGSIPSMGGIDTVPAMLSGGEFIMNRSAAQNIGAGNLQALNAGAGSIVTEEKTEELNDKLIAKLDELIEASGGAGSITINVEGSTGNSQETSNGQNSEQKQQLARQIRDAVLKVIQEEKRLGGSLRR